MTGLSSQGHNNNYLYHLYHPTKIVYVVDVVMTTLIGGAMIFYHYANTIYVAELWLASYSCVSFYSGHYL